MPLFQYFGWVGSFLLAALLAANWCFPAPIAPLSDVSLDQKINIRIHTDHKWPERVVFDTTGTMLAQRAGWETGIGGSEPAGVAERQPLDALAQMAAIPDRPCFRPPCSAQAAERGPLPIEQGGPSQKRAGLSMTKRKGFTFPNPLHKPRGRS